MIALLTLVICSIAMPMDCHEFQPPQERMSLMACVSGSQAFAASWQGQHPGWRVQRIRCGGQPSATSVLTTHNAL
jgi:hypothetical protein